jgi:undecaprenyl diphosphate synthase
MSEKIKERIKKFKQRNLPRHIAIIMDGNGRWAKSRGLKRTEGHKQGAKRAEEIVRFAAELGIKHLTLFAFSKENWNRPKEEIDFLMKLMADFLKEKIDDLLREGICLKVLGDISELPPLVQKELKRAVERSSKNDRLHLNLAINYGGRQEILRAVRLILKNHRTRTEVDEKLFSSYLYTEGIPDPDLIIRTSGEERISNFLLWQSAYSEFWVTKTLWPDFGWEDLLEAIENFQSRKRKFGRVLE